ncbi:hypothetical protein [Campylobacter helveticus]|uniref:hypothetical protein n=1 Tax=Campylobacter helveticus TaxID=28898 RepID=UPI00214A0980|nr:hypothetical protein [Campylobacter helveticus]MCR2062511.1 hypothetical protein [Campylobacter helveticus]
MKKVLKVALASSVLASAFLVGCGEDSLADIKDKQFEVREDMKEKKNATFAEKMAVEEMDNELFAKYRELEKKLAAEKLGEEKNIAKDYIEALKNNDIDGALKLTFFEKYNLKEVKVNDRKEQEKEEADKINKMLEILDFSKEVEFVSSEKSPVSYNVRVVTYKVLDKNGKTRNLKINMKISSDTETWKVKLLRY